MIKYICDSCGSEDKVGRVTLNMAVSTPHSVGAHPSFDKELCPACLKKLREAITAAIAMADPDRAKRKEKAG